MTPSVSGALPRPSVMGVLNVTPDSFSDGGRHGEPSAAVERARRMIEEGAAIVDIGGESTRPGSLGVGVDEELRRVVPVLEQLQDLPVSIDTSKATVARAAIDLGARMVNDVTALRADAELAEAVAAGGALLCLVHMRGEPSTMQNDPRYDDVVSEVASFLEERLAFAVSSGIPEERICIDPGFGFGKTVSHNLELVAGLDTIAAIGPPVLVGLSRKRFLARILGDTDAEVGSVAASVSMAVMAFERGASIVRVHDVGDHVQALAAAHALEQAA